MTNEKTHLTVGRMTLLLSNEQFDVSAPIGQPCYKWASEVLQLKIVRFPWGKWVGYLSIPSVGVINTVQCENEVEASELLVARIKEFHAELEKVVDFG
jgi:hypothetical protein